MGEFDFEKLNVYKRAIEFADAAFRIAELLPNRLQSSLGDQLRRAALSICNNIAEGSGKTSAKEKRQSYRYSLDSARECIPVMFLMKR